MPNALNELLGIVNDIVAIIILNSTHTQHKHTIPKKNEVTTLRLKEEKETY
jgi:hypothetical protein